jgi:D-alanine transaminase
MPIVRIDGDQIGDGKPGPVATRMRSAFHEVAEKLA